MRQLLLLPLLFISATPAKIHTVYTSLNPQSIPEHLAFYQLYPESSEGKMALHHAWTLLTKSHQTPPKAELLSHLSPAVNTLVALITKEPLSDAPQLTSEELTLIFTAGKNLHNRKLKGFYTNSEAEVLALPPEEIDLARGLLLSMDTQNAKSYEAMIDLMALQILAKLPINASPYDKIDGISAFIFDEMGFKFPPHSQYSEDIDLYTFLPAVLDSRRGVCLGVSILYLCLAQRLDLPLEIVTPPGHIYVRYKERNIETTARGIHIDSKEYLGVDTRSLQIQNIKNVIGMAHMNGAARYWHTQEHHKVKDSYMKALPYMAEDMLLKQLMGYNAIILDDEAGKKQLPELQNYIPDHAVTGDTMIDDFLQGRVDKEGLEVIFQNVDEDMESIKNKQVKIKAILKKHPRFRAGIFALATTWLQLHRLGEALENLERYHELDPGDPTVEYYLAAINMTRLNYNKAWRHLEAAEAITKRRAHYPKALKELRQELHHHSPNS